MRIEAKWIDMFEHVFRLCGVQGGDACAVLSQTQTRPELPQLSELALLRIGARPFHLVLPGRPLAGPVPVRSTGASDAIDQLEPVVQALAGCVAAFECETVSSQVAGDHRLFVGRVLAFAETALPPLVFQGGHYHLLGEIL